MSGHILNSSGFFTKRFVCDHVEGYVLYEYVSKWSVLFEVEKMVEQVLMNQDCITSIK